MAQSTPKFIDLTKTYIPGDPNAFPENLNFNSKDDYPNQGNPILAYEGWNFLPTSYGVKSYFGLNGVLDGDPVSANVDYVILYQTLEFENKLIALTDVGIFMRSASTAEAWTHVIVLDAPAVGTHRDWSFCMIGEQFYMYRQAGESVYIISPHLTFWIPADPVQNLEATVDTADNTGTIPAGDYTYYVTYVEDVTGHIAVQGSGVDVTVPTLGDSVDLTWEEPLLGTVDEYVIIRYDKTNELYEYKLTGSATESFTDTGAGWTANPDNVSYLPGMVEADPYDVQSKTPNTLNMAGQIGIFKAGSRLGFWDSENAFSWSNLDDKMDFAPSQKTLANTGQKFDDVIGRVVTVLSSKENFVIYATKSILFIRREISEAFIWKSIPITNKAGVAYPKEVCQGQVDTEHFAYSSMGLLRIADAQYELILTNVIDFLRESKDPVYPRLIQNRYLFLSLINSDYIYGKVSFSTHLVLPVSVTFGDAAEVIDDPDAPGCQKYEIITKIADQVVAYRMHEEDWADLDFLDTGYPIGVDIPVYEGVITYYGLTADSLGSNSQVNLDRIPTEGAKADVPGDLIDLSWLGTDPYSFSALTNTWTFTDIPLAVDMVAAGLPSTETEFTYTGDLDTLIPEVMQKWDSMIRFFNKYIDSLDGLTDTDMEVVTGSSPVPSALQTNFLNNFNNGNDFDSAASFAVPAYVISELGPLIVEGSNVDGIDNASITFMRHATKVKYLVMERSGAYSNPQDLGGGSYSGDLTMTVTAHVFEVSIDPCVGVTVNTGHSALDTYLETLALSHQVESTVFRVRMSIDHFIQYAADGSSSVSATPAPAAEYVDVCTLEEEEGTEDSYIFGTLFGGWNTSTGSICGNTPETPAPIYSNVGAIVIPASSFLLQDGSPAPLYPTFVGALVYDLHLKRWGKFRGDYKELLDYAPINNNSTGIIPYEVFGVEGAIIDSNGEIKTFDEAPSDSYIKYGKIGYTRQGFTDAEFIKADFRRGSTGRLGIVASLDGRLEEASLTSYTEFADEVQVIHPIVHPTTGYGVSAQWYSITLTGLFDLQYLEFNGHKKGRR